jgi:dinuclear metal center YbgI/SA1388 family protein
VTTIGSNTATTVDRVARLLETIAPVRLAADWDNVGLLVGDRLRPVARLMTCLTITGPVVDEALDEKVDLVVAHHPLPFRPLKTLTTDTHEGRLIWQLASAGVSVYSAHTAFDSAGDGINQAWAEGLGLTSISPLEPIRASDDPAIGVGRMGEIAGGATLGEVVVKVKQLLQIDGLHLVGAAGRKVKRIGIACGSAGEMLDAAIAERCDVFVTGEARFHTVLSAEAAETAMVLVGHYASERFGMENLAVQLAAALTGVTVWASKRESDPLRWA